MNHKIIEKVLDLAVKIQLIPSPTFEEERRALFIEQQFKQAGIEDISTDECGNIYACIRGAGRKPGIVVSAHLDTVFDRSTNITSHRTDEKIYGPGIGDNSIGLAALFGLYWGLTGLASTPRRPSGLQGDLWLVANVGEEGLGDLRGMKSVVNRLGNEVMAFIVLEGMSFRQIYHRGLGVRRYRIRVQTKGGHSWIDFGNPSAIHEIAGLVVRLKNLDLLVDPKTTLNVGMIQGGTSVNSIAAEASLELDLRSVRPDALNKIIGEVMTLIGESNQKGGDDVHLTAEIIGDRPAGEISAAHPLVKLASDCYARHGIEAKLNIASTDANVPLSHGLPAICIGLTSGGGAHTREEYIDIPTFSQGLEILVEIVQALFRQGIEQP